MNSNRMTELSQLIQEQWTAHNSAMDKIYSSSHTVRFFCKPPWIYKLLRVTAVLTARDDGSQALGKIENGQVIPAEPYLRNPLKHKYPWDNYIKDWIKLANLQLLCSGARFGLDDDCITYTLEKNTFLHERECWDEPTDAQSTEEFFNQRAAESPDSPYRDSVILLFRWGKDPDHPSLQACSDVTSNHVLMPGQ
ncbi:MAG: hypothetical protein JSV84_11905 [Gemmatimonadota bacterium]|nr:MAG: hypothetical protein JSV84_11905 [Gemmatimonadota bacterium]